MERSTLSVVLATFNEEKNLPDCLESVKGLADEIIVVDGSSTDKTVEIAKKYKAKIKVTDNPPIFHINKQKAIDMATMDWILQLDADERVTSELAQEIKNVVNSNENGKRKMPARNASQNDAGGENGKLSTNGYWIPRKNYFLGRFLMKGGVYPDNTLRLYKRGKGKLPQKDVHEQAIVDGNVGYLKNPLLHFADREFSRYLLRYGRYTDLIANEIRNKKAGYSPVVAFKYLFILPVWWFLLTYGRHKGFMDSWQGFIFSFFSALRFPISYVKYLKRK